MQWNGNLVTFIDNILKIPCLSEIHRSELSLASRILSLTIDFSKFLENENKGKSSCLVRTIYYVLLPLYPIINK